MTEQDFDFNEHDIDGTRDNPGDTEPAVYPAVAAALFVALLVGLLHLTVTPQPKLEQVAYNAVSQAQIIAAHTRR